IVNEVPELRVVLLLLGDNSKYRGTTFADGKFAKLGKNIRFFNAFLRAHGFDVADDFIHHVAVVILKGKVVPYRETSTDIECGKCRAYFLELCENLQCFLELPPIV